MISAKQKAQEFLNEFSPRVECGDNRYSDKVQKQNAKECAIILVNHIINALRKDLPEIGLGKGYWHDVKKEIEKL